MHNSSTNVRSHVPHVPTMKELTRHLHLAHSESSSESHADRSNEPSAELERVHVPFHHELSQAPSGFGLIAPAHEAAALSTGTDVDAKIDDASDRSQGRPISDYRADDVGADAPTIPQSAQPDGASHSFEAEADDERIVLHMPADDTDGEKLLYTKK